MDKSFVPAPNKPTIKGPHNVLYDFNDGARVLLPRGEWLVEIKDDESGNILFSGEVKEGWVTSTKKYFVQFRIRVWLKGKEKPIVDHSLSLSGKNVLISFPVGTLGDLIGWVPYAERFRVIYGCNVTCTMAPNIIDIFSPVYPEINFKENSFYSEKIERLNTFYATYRVGLFFQRNNTHQPLDFRISGLHRTAGYILGVAPEEIRPDLRLDTPRSIDEPYVCIATMASSQAKFWNNPHGWNEVVSFLKESGYRVLCIDRDAVYGQGFVWNKIPHGAEDFTGNHPLKERIALLQHADFFIGLGSGLSWLAWGCHIPVVLISGFSLPGTEFHTPYRVWNSHVCNGCWEDTHVNFDHADFFWCPHWKGTDRQYECTRAITGKQVITHVKRLLHDLDVGKNIKSLSQ